MTDDNVRKMWSDAELDTALHDLHREAGSEDALASARAALVLAAGGPHDGRPLEGPPVKKRGGSWRWIAVAAAVAALTGGLVVAKEAGLPGVTDIGGPAGPSDPPLVLNGSDLPLPAHGYRHSVQSDWVLAFTADHLSSAYVERRVERWIPVEPQGLWRLNRIQTGNVRWMSGEPYKAALQMPLPSGDDQWAPGGRFPTSRPASIPPYPNMTTSRQNAPVSPSSTEPAATLVKPTNWDNPDADFITSLPTDPAMLRKMLAVVVSDSSREITARETLVRVRNVLEIGLANAAQRVALCQALATYPGVTTRPDTNGPGGTHGLGLEVDGVDHALIVIDPSTAQLLSSTEIDSKVGPIPAGTNTRESTYTFSTTLKPTS